MDDLSVKEKDLLERVKEKPELRTLFFRKVKGLKWFDELYGARYFDANNIPAPVPAKEEGYVNIPYWEPVNYLVSTVEEVAGQSAAAYAPRFLAIIADATAYAKANSFSNYRVWWSFAEVISQIPVEFITLKHLEAVNYWLEDKYDRGLVSEIVATKWFPKLLEKADNHALEIAQGLLNILFEVDYRIEEVAGRTKKNAQLRFDHYRAEKITRRIADLAGRRLGGSAVLAFEKKLTRLLQELGNDTWSAAWQPAVEDHEQNAYRDRAENVLLEAFRDSLCGYLDAHAAEACKYVRSLLESPYQTLVRVAIYCVDRNYRQCFPFTEKLINGGFLQTNFRHEIWHFLNRNYGEFDAAQKNLVMAKIAEKVRLDDGGEVLEGASAYERSTWLAAIKDFGAEEAARYQEAVRVAGVEPDHPDFSSYSSAGPVDQKSPYTVEELGAFSPDELAKTLCEYRGGGGWQEPGIEGLSKAVKQTFKSAPLKYCDQLDSFKELDLAYVYSIIEAYRELWSEKAGLPWDGLWKSLLEYIAAILKQDLFWQSGNAERRKEFVANRYWVVGSIARLLEAGAKSDDHAFPEKYHTDVEVLLRLILEREEGEIIDSDSDAVSIAINSPRGQTIEALINLALRACRLQDRLNSRDHSEAWEKYRCYFDAELERSKKGVYEFAVLVTNYLPNFLYMSNEWVLGNLSRIFDQADYVRWSCAIQGYSYVSTVYQEIYSFLKVHGDILRVLDDKIIKDRVEERFLQHIVVAYVNDYESLDDENGLMRAVLNRAVFDELQHLIWFTWTLRKEDDEKTRKKVYALWPLVLGKMNFSRKEDRKLASHLCHWAGFVDHLDEERKKLLAAIAPYAGEAHNSYDLLVNLARISEKQPFEANEIWRTMLQGAAEDYPEEAIKKLLVSLVEQGPVGVREARETVSLYLQKGMIRPSEWLTEIVESSKIQ